MRTAGLLLVAGVLAAGVLAAHPSRGQLSDAPPPAVSVRLSCLLVPFTPLLTVEVKAVGPLTLQGETNFGHTHGLNLKWYRWAVMQGGYGFVGAAWVRHSLLRADNRTTWLPYVGGGYAWAFGRHWAIDARAGLGPAVNADLLRLYPVVKVGAGRRF